jgi:hypothetical protein
MLMQGADFDIATMWVNNPDIEAELNQMKNRHPRTYAPVPVPSDQWVFPASFPVLINTGNPEGDKERLAQAKQDWIESHPDEYKTITGCEYMDESNRYNK